MAPYIALDGDAYMNSLPPGTYTFTAINQCGGVMTRTLALSGYTTTVNDFNIVKHCGAFDIQFQHVSNGTYTQNFYLQKYNAVQGTWEHPLTGIDYAEGTQANSLNSVPLVNNGNNLSYPYTGLFRVIKTFFVYDNGTNANIRCYNVLYTFTVEDGPVITDAYSFPCDTGLTEVAIIAEGVPPFTYSITTKNGQPFAVNNGTSNLFTGLESAIYNFKVTDNCGYIRNIQFDIDALEPLAIQAQGFCEGEASSLFVPGFEFMDYKWYKEGAPGTVLSTSEILNFSAYNSATQSGIYHVSITTDNPLSCMNQDLSFTLGINALPDAGADNIVPFCNDGIALNLKDYLAAGIVTTGIWEDVDNTGLLTNSTLTTAPLPEGTYHFKYTVNGLCDLADDAMLTLQVKNRPQTPVVSSNTPVCENDTLTLTSTAVAGATYAWTGPNGFTSTEVSPVLTNVSTAASGTYLLTITVNECASPQGIVTITVNAAPKAGDDAAVQLCNEGDAVNLEDYLTALADTGGAWEDTDGAGTLNGSTLATAGVAQGTYHFKYTVTNICNSTDEAFITLELKDIPPPPTVNTVAPVCEGTDVQLFASAIANAVYNWTGPDGFASNEQSPLIAAAGMQANGSYSLTVTVNDCTSDTVVVPVTVYALPQFSIDGNTALCEGQTSELTVVPDNFNADDVEYTWYLEGTQLAETSGKINISQVGQYEVSVNNNNCMTNLSFDVTVNSNPFDLVLDSGCINYEYKIWVVNIADIDGAVVTWTGPDGFSFTGTEANITNLPEGDYTATVTNSENCTANATLNILNTSCIIPRGISPNGDGLNDSFDLSNLDVREIKIFNRYGLKVYEAKKYLKEWHGQSDKGTLPTATYYYVITLSAGKQVTGWVYLNRQE
jgi:gliding motility-associated-like protein